MIDDKLHNLYTVADIWCIVRLTLCCVSNWCICFIQHQFILKKDQSQQCITIVAPLFPFESCPNTSSTLKTKSSLEAEATKKKKVYKIQFPASNNSIQQIAVFSQFPNKCVDLMALNCHNYIVWIGVSHQLWTCIAINKFNVIISSSSRALKDMSFSLTTQMFV